MKKWMFTRAVCPGSKWEKWMAITSFESMSLFWIIFANRFILYTLFPRRDKKGLRWTPLMTVPKKFHYFSSLKNVFKTWFRRPTNDLVELCFLWFYMCFCKKNHLNSYFETLYGLFLSWWPNQVIIWYFEPKKPKISVFWGIVCFVATFLQVLICKITKKVPPGK